MDFEAVQLNETSGIKESIDPFPGSQPAAGMLFGDSIGAAGLEGTLISQFKLFK